MDQRKGSILYILAGALIACAAFLVYNAAQPPPQQLTETDIEEAVQHALESRTDDPSRASVVYPIIQPSLVSIEAERSLAGKVVERCTGTGFVVDAEGTVLTCCHIVNRASKVTLRFSNGFETTGTVEDIRPACDIAIVHPDSVAFVPVPAVLADPGSLKIGDEVFATGDPFGIAQSFTAGVVSGLGRACVSTEAGVTLTNLIQFDAAVNPGNSGGPLVNRDGEVVGIVTTIVNPADEKVFIGIGFAMPVEKAMDLISPDILPTGLPLSGL